MIEIIYIIHYQLSQIANRISEMQTQADERFILGDIVDDTDKGWNNGVLNAGMVSKSFGLLQHLH